MNEHRASTSDTISSVEEVASAESLDTPEPYPAESQELLPRKKSSLIRAFTVATILPFARLDEELFRNRAHEAIVAQSPYVLLLGDELGEEGIFTPVFAFSLGGSQIIVPKRVNLNDAALRALAIGKTFLKPIIIEAED